MKEIVFFKYFAKGTWLQRPLVSRSEKIGDGGGKMA